MYLIGTISGASGSSFNTFPIPKGARFLYFEPSSTGLSFQMGVAPTGPSGTFQTTAQGSNPIVVGPASIGFRVPRLDPNAAIMVAIYNPNGGNVSVAVFGGHDT